MDQNGTISIHGTQRLVRPPHSIKVLRSVPGSGEEPFCVELVCFPCVHFPLTHVPLAEESKLTRGVSVRVSFVSVWRCDVELWSGDLPRV